ncbi:MAG TPA: hypothetical protein VNF07_11920 [Acidimicrobiales bacterium]|nr:hypothetical protein [Acidimicrobiales bacterium]
MWVVAAVETAASALFFALGVRPNRSLYALTGPWQVLDRFYLQHHLWQSLFDLHVQPPLYNLLVGGYIAVGSGGAEFAMLAVNLLLGLVLVCSTYLLLVELEVPVAPSAALAAAVALAPSTLLYESWEFYTFPTAALLSLACYCGVRALGRGGLRPALGCAAAASGVVLLNSTFQWPWLVVLLAPLAVKLRRSPRLVALALSPLLVVGALYVKDAVVFGSDSTSSMLGMNLSKTALLTAPPGLVSSLVSEHKLSPIALQPPFQPVSVYEPQFVAPTTRRAPVLREVLKRDRVGPNLNNAAIVPISSVYLRADLTFIAGHPLDYLASITRGVRLWLVPSEEYVFLDPNESRIAPYVDFVDRYLLLQPTRWNGTGYTPPTPGAGQLSYGALLADGLSLLGLPLLAWRSRERARRWALFLIWVTIAYAFVLTSLVEYGENNRFRFDLGSLPLVGAVVVLAELLRRRAVRRAGEGHPAALSASSGTPGRARRPRGSRGGRACG